MEHHPRGEEIFLPSLLFDRLLSQVIWSTPLPYSTSSAGPRAWQYSFHL